MSKRPNLQPILHAGVIRTGSQNSRLGAGTPCKYLILLEPDYSVVELYAHVWGELRGERGRITPAVAVEDSG